MYTRTVVIVMLSALVLCGCDGRQSSDIEPVNLNAVPEGTYTGQAQYKTRTYDVQVMVRGNRIEGLGAKRTDGQADKWDKKAMEVLTRIGNAQTVQVDVKTGATPISKALAETVSRTLRDAEAAEPAGQ